MPKVIFDLLLTDGKSTCICFFMTDVIVLLFVTSGVVGRCYCHVVRWLMINAIVTDVEVTLCYSG